MSNLMEKITKTMEALIEEEIQERMKDSLAIPEIASEVERILDDIDGVVDSISEIKDRIYDIPYTYVNEVEGECDSIGSDLDDAYEDLDIIKKHLSGLLEDLHGGSKEE